MFGKSKTDREIEILGQITALWTEHKRLSDMLKSIIDTNFTMIEQQNESRKAINLLAEELNKVASTQLKMVQHMSNRTENSVIH